MADRGISTKRSGDDPEGGDAAQAATRQRLLEVAGEVFADVGFRGATVRDICGRAGANIASVNYHFGDKESLYAAAVRFAHDCAKLEPLLDSADPSIPPRQQLERFVRAFLTSILHDGRPAWHTKLMAREMAEPSAVLDVIVQNAIRPRFETLSNILRGFLGPDAPPELIQRCATSIVGQILFYHFAKPVLKRLLPHQPLDQSAVDVLVGHITHFSACAVECLATENATKAKRGKGQR